MHATCRRSFMVQGSGSVGGEGIPGWRCDVARERPNGGSRVGAVNANECLLRAKVAEATLGTRWREDLVEFHLICSNNQADLNFGNRQFDTLPVLTYLFDWLFHSSPFIRPWPISSPRSQLAPLS